MLATIRDYLKTLDSKADHYSIGKIDNSKDKSIGVYGDGYQTRVEAVGRASSYDTAGIRILIHWNKNANATEAFARSLYEELRYIQDTDMGTVHVQYLDLTYSEPIFLGTDENGVYEYLISCVVYFRR